MLPAHSNNRAQSSSRVTILYALYNIAFALPGQIRRGRSARDYCKRATPEPLLAFAVTRPVTSREMSIAVVPRGTDCRNRISSGERGHGEPVTVSLVDYSNRSRIFYS